MTDQPPAIIDRAEIATSLPLTHPMLALVSARPTT